MLFLLLFTIELGWLGFDTYKYIKTRQCPYTVNGRIINAIDEKINFSRASI